MAGSPNNTTSASVLNAACTDTEVTLSDLLLVPPFRMMVTGPSSAGKSTFVLNFVKYRRQVCAEQFGRILYCRPDSDQTEHSKSYVEAMREEFDNLEVVAGLPDLSMCRSGDHCLVILDDLANDIFGSKDMLDLFTRDSHHGKISVIITSQRFFTKKKHGKDIVAQMTYHVIFSMPADMSTVEYLSRCFTGKSKILHSIFAFIEKEFDGPGNNYLLINFHPRSIKHQAILKLRTAIFPRKSPMGTMEIMPVVFMLGK